MPPAKPSAPSRGAAVRGSAPRRLGGVLITPAHAGRSAPRRRSARARRLYPRARGEVPPWLCRMAVAGPLPPAHAGRSTTAVPGWSGTSLYPRAHGEVDPASRQQSADGPLPPCTRGSLHDRVAVVRQPPSTSTHVVPTTPASSMAVYHPLNLHARGADTPGSYVARIRVPQPPRTWSRLAEVQWRVLLPGSTSTHVEPTRSTGGPGR